jgi:hypothetical protein
MAMKALVDPAKKAMAIWGSLNGPQRAALDKGEVPKDIINTAVAEGYEAKQLSELLLGYHGKKRSPVTLRWLPVLAKTNSRRRP